jgi:hypothetical protein
MFSSNSIRRAAPQTRFPMGNIPAFQQSQAIAPAKVMLQVDFPWNG